MATALAVPAVASLAPRGLEVQRPLAHADAIVVMAGSGAYLERAALASRLYREARAPLVVLTDEGTKAGWSEELQRNPTFAELTVGQLVREGVSPGSVVMLPVPTTGHSTRTVDEVDALLGWVRERGVRSLIVVTSTYHARRTDRTFTRISGDRLAIGIEAAPAACCGSLWWTSLTGWRAVAGEYVKLVYQGLVG